MICVNVALTRAREGLVVVGDRSTLLGSGVVREEEEAESRVRFIWKEMIEGMLVLQAEEVRKAE